MSTHAGLGGTKAAAKQASVSRLRRVAPVADPALVHHRAAAARARAVRDLPAVAHPVAAAAAGESEIERDDQPLPTLQAHGARRTGQRQSLRFKCLSAKCSGKKHTPHRLVAPFALPAEVRPGGSTTDAAAVLRGEDELGRRRDSLEALPVSATARLVTS